MTKLKKFTVCSILCLVFSLPGLVFTLDAKDKSPHFTIKEAVSKIKIDGVLNEEAWKHPVKIKVPYEWTRGGNRPAPVETECLVTFDEANFYVAFRCFDPDPKKIRAHLMDRDQMDTFVQDDYVSILIDTFNDELRAFQFRVNVFGVQADAIFSELEGYEDFSWDAIWKSKGRITDFGYVVEMAIPFNQLRFPKGKGVQTWGFSASRSYPRNIRYRMSIVGRDRNVSCLLCQFPKITGLQGISPGKNIELDPTLTAVRTDTREGFPTGGMQNGEIDVEPGISGRWGITPNLTLNAAINPDFSQVEADAAQLEVNTRFALRYPEKRPFFLEGADLFLTPMEAVFTRTVFDPVWGAKVTGKTGKNAFGLFVTQDRTTNLIFPSNQGSGVTSLDQDVFGGVFRYRRDLGKGSTMGVLYTGKAGEDYSNHVAGVDGFFRLSRTKTLSLQYLHSETDYPGAVSGAFGQPDSSFGGNVLLARLMHRSRSLNMHFIYEDRSGGFRSDFGFVPRVDLRRIDIRINPMLWGKEGAWYDRLATQVRFTNITDKDNNLTDRELEFTTAFTGALQTYTTQSYVRRKELYLGKMYDLDLGIVYLVMKPFSGFSLVFYGEAGDSIDYSNARAATQLLTSTTMEFGIGRNLNVNLNHLFQRLSVDSEKIFSAHLLQTRLVYNFNVRTFVRAIVQYYDLARNPALYTSSVNPETRTLFTQLLFSYKINPQTVLFLGYSDNHLGFRGLDITRTNRTFFLKLGYAWVM
jgi:hypothetical protein